MNKISEIGSVFRNAKRWNDAIDLAAEGRYQESKHLLERLVSWQYSGSKPADKNFEWRLLHGVVCYQLCEFENAEISIRSALRTLNDSKMSIDDKNYISDFAVSILTHMECDVADIETTGYDNEKVS